VRVAPEALYDAIMPSFSITRTEAVLGASTPAITRSMPTSSKA
jgi:hypothetical protein